MRFGEGYGRWAFGGAGGPGERWDRMGQRIAEEMMDGRPRGRRRVFDGGELRIVLLKLVEEGPRHGYDLIRAVEERTGGAYAPSPGVVYPTLTLLEDMGQLDEQKGEGTRRLFAITDAGRSHLAERADEVAALFARLDALGGHARRADRSPVRRAMHNLRNVLRDRVGDEDARGHEIADLIDDLARRIERL